MRYPSSGVMVTVPSLAAWTLPPLPLTETVGVRSSVVDEDPPDEEPLEEHAI